MLNGPNGALAISGGYNLGVALTSSITLKDSGVITASSLTIASDASTTGSFTQSGGTLNVGTLDAGLGAATHTWTGGTLNAQTVNNMSLVNQGGTLSPGGPGVVGTTTISSGDYSQNSASTMAIDLAPTFNANDQLAVPAGTALLAGTLTIAKAANQGFHEGQSFQIINTAAISGTFDTVSALPALPSFLSWDTSALYTMGTLTVVKTGTYATGSATWNLPGSGTWYDTASWTPGVIPNDVDQTANFHGGLTANAVVGVDGPKTVSKIDFDNSTYSYTIQGIDAITLMTSSGTPTINVTSGSHTISAPLAGYQGLSITGSGKLTLSGANDSLYGDTQIGTGMTVVAGSSTAFGAGYTVYIADGATLDVNGQNLTGLSDVTIAGAGVGGNGAIVNSGAVQQNGFTNLTLSADATIGGTGRWDVRPAVSGTVDLAGHTLTKTGTNEVSFVGVTVTDGNIVVDNGILGLEKGTTVADFSTGTNITVNSGGVLVVGDFGTALNLTRPITLDGGTMRSSNYATIGSNITITGTGSTLDNPNGDLQLYGSLLGSADVQKTGGWTLRLYGDNHLYSGTFTNHDGNAVWFFAANSGSENANWVNDNNLLIETDGIDVQLGSLSGPSNAALSTDYGSGSGLGASYTIGGKNVDSTYAGQIRDAYFSTSVTKLAINKVGTGNLTLSGGLAQQDTRFGFRPTATSTFSGNITVSGSGKLIGAAVDTLNSDGSIAGTVFGAPLANRTITVNSGATMVWGAANIFGGHFVTTVPTLVINGGTVTNADIADEFDHSGDPAGTVYSHGSNNALNNLVLNNGTLTSTTGCFSTVDTPTPPVPGWSDRTYGAWDINGTVTSHGNSLITTTATANGQIMLASNGPSGGPFNATFDVRDGVSDGFHQSDRRRQRHRSERPDQDRSRHDDDYRPNPLPRRHGCQRRHVNHQRHAQYAHRQRFRGDGRNAQRRLHRRGQFDHRRRAVRGRSRPRARAFDLSLADIGWFGSRGRFRAENSGSTTFPPNPRRHVGGSARLKTRSPACDRAPPVGCYWAAVRLGQDQPVTAKTSMNWQFIS